MEVAICIATYRRPAGLEELLESLVSQRGMDGLFGIIVVDNDPSGTSHHVIDSLHHPGIDVHYEIEQEPGIPAARNRSVSLARSAGASYVAFIDDDEFATPFWLATLYHRIQATGADAASGPVEPLFPAESPRWARETRLFHRSTFRDGERLEYASTANAMLRLDAIAGHVEPFNPNFRFTGGSDSYLFRSIRQEGKTIIWDPAALVYERVPLERISQRWITLRSYRQGITLARCDKLLASKRRVILARAVRGIAQIPVGAAEIIASLARKDQRWRKGLVRMARGVGVIAGLSGVTYDEYERRDSGH